MSSLLDNITKRIGTISVPFRNGKKAEAAKILADVSQENAFAFSISEGSFTGARARNLIGLYTELKTVDIRSVEFHLYRMDFENWVQYLGDLPLAQQIAKIRAIPFEGERTRNRIVEAVGKRISQLSR
jgi:hypothetical protein